VKTVKLDHFLEGKKVDFIRMDIEGYEKEALMGLEQTLKSNRAPKYFFIEIHCLALNNKGSSAREIVNYLKNYGYSVKKAFYRGSLKKTAQSTEELLNHPYLEKGYWETFFEKNESFSNNSNL
jgi:tRNA G26 N,N-dimethylase Trm1